MQRLRFLLALLGLVALFAGAARWAGIASFGPGPEAGVPAATRSPGPAAGTPTGTGPVLAGAAHPSAARGEPGGSAVGGTPLRGRVWGPDGTRVARAWIRLLPGPVARDRLQRDTGRELDWRDDGTFQLPAEATAASHLFVRAPDFVWRCVPAVPDPETGWIEVVLQSRGVLEGSIRDALGNVPTSSRIGIHRVQADGTLASSGYASVDGRGGWRVTRSDGVYLLRAGCQSGPLGERRVVVRAGERERWDIRLEEAAYAAGRLDLPACDPGCSYDVHLCTGSARVPDTEDGFLDNEWTNADDRSFRLLGPTQGGPYWLFVFRDGSRLPCAHRGPWQGGVPDVRIRLSDEEVRHVTVRGRVLRPPPEEDEFPPSWFAVLTDRHGFETYDHVEKETGRYALSPVPRGTYELLIQAYGDEILHRQRVVVSGGEDLLLPDIDLRATPLR